MHVCMIMYRQNIFQRVTEGLCLQRSSIRKVEVQTIYCSLHPQQSEPISGHKFNDFTSYKFPVYVQIVRHCGVIFVQGIRDSSKTVIHEFLDTVNRYYLI